MKNTKSILNYLGQLRPYSFFDFFVFATALTRDASILAGLMFLWLSFLLYLEGKHKDELRLRINGYAWVLPGFLSCSLLPIWLPFAFGLFSFLYTRKKGHSTWAVTSPLWRGLQNAVIAIAFQPGVALLAFCLIFFRNTVADFRDAEADAKRNIRTIPVRLGIRKNQHWAFYGHLFFVVATTLVWSSYSWLHWTVIAAIIIWQIVSYPLTPRLSSPAYLDFYSRIGTKK